MSYVRLIFDETPAFIPVSAHLQHGGLKSFLYYWMMTMSNLPVQQTQPSQFLNLALVPKLLVMN